MLSVNGMPPFGRANPEHAIRMMHAALHTVDLIEQFKERCLPHRAEKVEASIAR